MNTHTKPIYVLLTSFFCQSYYEAKHSSCFIKNKTSAHKGVEVKLVIETVIDAND